MPTKTKSKLCGYPLGSSLTCTKKTKHASGKCHYHRGMTAGGDVAVAADADGSADVADEPLVAPSDEDLVLPLPESGPEPGDPFGVSVMVADGEVEDSSLTAQRYLSADGSPHHFDMLHLKLTPEGEGKMLDALGLNTTITKHVTEDVEKVGTHPLDVNLGSQVGTIARSYNARLKQGESLDEIRGVNGPRLEQLEATLAGAAKEASAADAAAQEMLAHYQSHVDILKERIAEGFTPAPYTEGGKLPQMDPWEGKYVMQETKEVQIPNPNVDDALLPASEVKGQRVDPSYDQATGLSSWYPGQMSSEGCPKKMWKVDLGDGYMAYYFPQKFTGDSSASQVTGGSKRRRMTVVSPKDGEAKVALEKLQQLYLNTAPMTRAGSEFAYLDRNIHTLGLGKNHEVLKAREEAANYANALAVHLVESKAHEAAELTEPQQRDWLRQQRLTADANALPYRAKRLRDAVATTLGYPSGESLRKDPVYRPLPKHGRGKPTYDRLPEEKGGPSEASGKSFQMNITGGSSRIVDVARSGGVMACQERRRMMGISELGMSEGSDVQTRGASGVFTHYMATQYSSPPSSGHSQPQVVWSGQQAAALSRRSDYWVTPGDHFGKVTTGTRKLSEHQKFGSSAEAMFEDTISFQQHPPTWIVCTSKTQRDTVIKELKKKGMSVFADGRSVEDVVVN